MSKFVVITTSEDGDVFLEVLTEDELTKKLNDQEEPLGTFKPMPKDGRDLFVREKEGVYIVKGDLVTPQPKTVVKEWTVK
jgi:hypothetical protein